MRVWPHGSGADWPHWGDVYPPPPRCQRSARAPAGGIPMSPNGTSSAQAQPGASSRPRSSSPRSPSPRQRSSHPATRSVRRRRRSPSCGVNLRARARRHRPGSEPSSRPARELTVVTSLTGSRYRTTCAKSPSPGSSWYRISARQRPHRQGVYGVSYLYAARGLFGVPRPDEVRAVLASSCAAALR